jgi:prepilin-type N-terminal cleavage/methylation domain-containing protein
MLKNLSIKKQQGFTLVELLVAIAIIAILAVIGLTVFTGLQRSARDAQRRSDVEAIGKAMEANYDQTTAQYPALLATMFAAGKIPVDPLDNSSNCATANCVYCMEVQTGGGTNPVDATGGSSGVSCASSGASLFGRTTNVAKVAAGVPTVAATGFLACTNLEGGAGNTTPTHYCIGSQR